LDSLAAGKKSMEVRCYKVCERLHIIELKEYTVEKAETTAARASGIFMAASKRAYDATAFVAGKERATGLFTVIGKRLPIVKRAIRSAASTGTLSDSSSTDGDLNVDSSTGSIVKASAAPAAVTSHSKLDESPEKDDTSIASATMPSPGSSNLHESPDKDTLSDLSDAVPSPSPSKP